MTKEQIAIGNEELKPTWSCTIFDGPCYVCVLLLPVCSPCPCSMPGYNAICCLVDQSRRL